MAAVLPSRDKSVAVVHLSGTHGVPRKHQSHAHYMAKMCPWHDNCVHHTLGTWQSHPAYLLWLLQLCCWMGDSSHNSWCLMPQTQSWTDGCCQVGQTNAKHKRYYKTEIPFLKKKLISVVLGMNGWINKVGCFRHLSWLKCNLMFSLIAKTIKLRMPPQFYIPV